MSKQGGPLTPVVLHEAETLATDATRLFWDWQGDTSAQFQDAWIAEQSLDGGALGYVANPVTFPTRLAVDDSYVYWAQWLVWGYPADGQIMKAPK